MATYDAPFMICFDPSTTASHYLGDGAFESQSGCSIATVSSRQVLRITGGSGFAHRPVPDLTAITMGMRLRGGTTGFGGACLQWRNSGGTAIADLHFNAGTGVVSLRRGSTTIGATTTSFLDALHYLEVDIVFHDSTGSFTIKVDGATEDSDSNIDTMDTTGPVAAVRYLGQSSSTFDWTDLYIRDRPVSDFFWGPLRVHARYVNGDDSPLEWTPSSAVDHYTLIDDVPPGAGYIETNTVGNIDAFTVQDLSVSGTVRCVSLFAIGQRPNSGGGTVTLNARSGSATGTGTARTLTDSANGMIVEPFENDPQTASAWASAAVDALEIEAEATA